MKRLKLQTKTVVITNETSCKCFLLCSNLFILTRSFSISRFVYVTCGLCGKSLRSMSRLDIPPVFLTGCHLILSFWFHGDFSYIFPYLHGITRLFSQKLQVSLRESSESSENCSHKKFHWNIQSNPAIHISQKAYVTHPGILIWWSQFVSPKPNLTWSHLLSPVPTKKTHQKQHPQLTGAWFFSGLVASGRDFPQRRSLRHLVISQVVLHGTARFYLFIDIYSLKSWNMYR